MVSVSTDATVDQAELAAILTPRQGVVLERRESDGRFTLLDGPFRAYERTVEVQRLPDGRAQIRQQVCYEQAARFFRWVFAWPFRRELARPVESARTPWWASPERLDPPAAAALDAMAAVAFVVGYLITLVPQTFTYVAAEFGTGKAAQGVTLATLRADVLISLVVVALADRKGRRALLLVATAAGAVLSAAGGAMPSLLSYAGSQLVARGFVTATIVLIAIMAAEELPAGSRAWGVGMLTMAGALGGGVCVFALPVTGIGAGGWRVLYALPLLALPFLLVTVARRLPESRRFQVPRARERPSLAGHGRRLALLALGGFLLNLFIVPQAQFQNEFLRTERAFSPSMISLFTVATVTPGAIGIVVGGRLADTRGRRGVAAVGAAVGVAVAATAYFTRGGALWLLALGGTVLLAALVPALGVYGPELFPTSLRGLANGVIQGANRIGGVIGLLAAGFLSHRLGSLSPAFAILAIGPLLLAILVLAAYPETRRRELEELNPEDRPATETAAAPPVAQTATPAAP